MEERLNKLIDLTYLKPDASRVKIEQLCADAIEYEVYSVCVPPYHVQQVARILEDYQIKVGTVIGFPYGFDATQVKIEAIKKAVEDNIDEIDVVSNIAAIKSGDWSFVMNDVDSMVRLAHMRNLTVKLIIEMNLLNEEEIKRICEIAVKKEVDFIKTSTGTIGDGVTPEDIRLIRSLVPESMKIKASGGIRTREQVLQLIGAGAGRIGTSSAKAILEK